MVGKVNLGGLKMCNTERTIRFFYSIAWYGWYPGMAFAACASVAIFFTNTNSPLIAWLTDPTTRHPMYYGQIIQR